MTAPNEACDHHYTPQFYMRRFAPLDDYNKVDAVWRHEPYVLRGRRSISGIGYEEDLHTLKHPGGQFSVERLITEGIETPLTATDTWRKIIAGDANALTTADDRMHLYVLACHLQARNLENLRFIEEELTRIQRFGFPLDYSVTEREIYSYLAGHPDRVKEFFLAMASDVRRFLVDLRNIGIQVLTSELRLRSSTQPVLAIPMTLRGVPLMPEYDPTLQIHWLPLGPHFGIMISKAPGMAFFSQGDLPHDTALMLNRLYVMQLLEGISVRYCFAGDPYVDFDLQWAGFGPPAQTKRGLKYERRTPKLHHTWLDQVWSRHTPESQI